MVPVLVLAIIAVILIKSLMSVVARDEVAAVPPWTPNGGSIDPTTDLTLYEPTLYLRARADEDVRAFLLPAAPEPGVSEPGVWEPEPAAPVDEPAGHDAGTPRP